MFIDVSWKERQCTCIRVWMLYVHVLSVKHFYPDLERCHVFDLLDTLSSFRDDDTIPQSIMTLLASLCRHNDVIRVMLTDLDVITLLLGEGCLC